MRKVYAVVFFLGSFLCGHGQADVTGTTGTPATYTTLKDAFDAINAGTYTGDVMITLTGNTTETATAALVASGTGAANYQSVTINAAAPVTVSGNLAGALVLLDGADNVIINGNTSLTLLNTNTGGNTVLFQNDATHNTINNTLIQGATLSSASGVIFFGGALTTGNDGNLIDNDDIDGMGSAVNCIMSSGTLTNATTENSSDTIRNCNIFNNQQNTRNTAGIFLNYGSTNWLITGNSIYQENPVTSTVEGTYYGIIALPAFISDANIISGNYVGGQTTTAAGSFSVTGTGANHIIGFQGIDVETGGPNSVVQNNTIRNISITYKFTDSSFQNAGIFAYLYSFSGTSTIAGNTVTNITLKNSAGLASIQGIAATGEVATATTITHTFNISNNTVSNLSGISGATGNVNAMGIRLNCHSANGLTNTATLHTVFNVNGNSLSALFAPFANNNTWARGISSFNTQGIGSSANLLPKFVITNNTISNLSSTSKTASYTQGVVEGIKLSGGSVINTTDVHTISGNIINNLNASQTADFGTTSIGIFATNGTYFISANRMYDLFNSAVPVSSHPGIVGILLQASQGTSTIANNFISLGNNVTANVHVFGIMNSTNGDPINLYYNSVVVMGSGNSGNTLGTAAFLRGTQTFSAVTTTTTIKDNILLNTRTGGSASHYALALPATTSYTSDYNDLYASTSGNLVLYGATGRNFNSYKGTSGQDANSLNTPVTFTNVTTADLHLQGQSLTDMQAGIALATIIVDYDGQARAGTFPYIGADEFVAVVPVTLLSFSGKNDGGINAITWSTSQEINSAYFEIQRSADGRSFSSIGKLAAAGNSSDLRTYSFMDSKAGTLNYYRLRIVSQDNTSKYSAVIRLSNSRIAGITVYPNPVPEQLQLSVLSDNASKAGIYIVNSNGQVVYRSDYKMVSGVNSVSVPVSALSKGIYTVKVVTEAGVSTKQFTKL